MAELSATHTRSHTRSNATSTKKFELNTCHNNYTNDTTANIDKTDTNNVVNCVNINDYLVCLWRHMINILLFSKIAHNQLSCWYKFV